MFIRIFITSYVSVSFLSTLPRFRLRTLKTEYDTRQIIIITVNIKKNIQFEKTGSIEVQLRLPAAYSCSYPGRLIMVSPLGQFLYYSEIKLR